jgi:hypothetical protein
MARRSITVELIPLTPPADETPRAPDSYFGPKRHFLEVEVAYNAGGMNYFSGETAARGYYLRMTPVYKETSKSGGESTGFTMFTGRALLLSPAKRYSATTLVKVAALAMAHPRYAAMMASTLAANNRTLLTPEPVVDSMVL